MDIMIYSSINAPEIAPNPTMWSLLQIADLMQFFGMAAFIYCMGQVFTSLFPSISMIKHLYINASVGFTSQWQDNIEDITYNGRKFSTHSRL
jgi:hypothetical protein